MGVLTDLVIADPGEAAAVAATTTPLDTWPGAEVKGHDAVTFACLFHLLTGGSPDDDVGDWPPVQVGSDEGPWVFAFDTDFVARLAAIVDPDVDALAAQWASIEELVGTPVDAVAEVIEDSRRVCREALSAGRSVLMRICL